VSQEVAVHENSYCRLHVVYNHPCKLVPLPWRLLRSGKTTFAPQRIPFSNKITASGCISSQNLPRGDFQTWLLNPDCLGAMDEWDDLHLKWVLHFCKFHANPTSISNLTVSSESQWNMDYNDILSVHKYCQLFMYESNTFLCEKHVILPIQTNGGANAEKSPKQPIPWVTWTPSNTPIPRPIPLTIPNGILIQSAVLLQYTFQSDRHTWTNRWARQQ